MSDPTHDSLGALEQADTYTAKQQRARLTICALADSSDDARQLLDALGLL